jgi:hypothetical protein
MLIGMHRNGTEIRTDSPDAALVFKTYGKPLTSGLVRLDLSGGALLFNPDTGSITETFEKTDSTLKERKKQKPKGSYMFKPMPSAAGGRCTITGDQATSDNAIVTEEGHIYTREGLEMLFSGGRSTARSPYPGAKPLVKSKYFSRTL